MNVQGIIDLILSSKFHEACELVEKMDFEMQNLHLEHHAHWRHVVRAKLRTVVPPTPDHAAKAVFYVCLSRCFDLLDDEQSKLAAQYQIVVNVFKCNSSAHDKERIISQFGSECAEKGYLQQAIQTYEEMVRSTNDIHIRDTLLYTLHQLYQKRFVKYFLVHNEIFDTPSCLTPKTPSIETLQRKPKAVRQAEQELARRKSLRATGPKL